MTTSAIVPGEAAAVARLLRGYLTVTAVVVAVVTGLTFLSPAATQMSPVARLVGAGLLLALQVTGARLDWSRRLLEGRGQLMINALVVGLTLVNSIQPMLSGPDEITAWGIAVTVVFAGLVTSPSGMLTVVGVVVASSTIAVARFASEIEVVAPVTATVVILVLGWLSWFAGRSYRQSLRERHAEQDAVRQQAETAQATQLATIAQLQRLDRLQDDFISTASHELRTPMTVILGLAATLERADLTLGEEARGDILRRLRSNAEGLNLLVTRVLDFDRIGGLSHEVARHHCDLVVATRLASGMVADGSHGVTFVVPPDLPAVRGSEVVLSRVIGELLGNAVRHTPDGTAVRVVAVVEPGGVRVRVSDDGDGIDDEAFAGLTTRFARGGRYETRETRGLGLGLAFCERVLTRLGSHLELDDTPTGTSISFVVPLPTSMDASAIGVESDDTMASIAGEG